MDFFKDIGPQQTNQLQTINLGYAPETYHQLPVMVELKPVTEDQRLQLLNFNSVQFTPQGQIQYVAQKVMPATCIQTQPVYLQPTTQCRTIDTQTDRLHPCEICGKRFKSSQSLSRHLPSHPEIPKTYICHHCDKKFGNQQALRRHQSKHPDIVYEWKCRFCPLSFPYKTTLSKHVKVHAGEKLFKCETCLKRFGNRYTLQRHVKIHTGEVPYKCEVCEKGFLKASDYGRHARTHTGERPFECPECYKCFTQKSCLVKHAEKKHNISL